MVQCIEAVVISDGDIRAAVKQEGHHVVPLLGDGVVEGCVSLGILSARRQCSSTKTTVRSYRVGTN